jgi:hypothetical protein
MKTKVITKLDAYKQSITDYEFAISQHKLLKEEITTIGNIIINNTFSIDAYSSERQFLFAIGVTKSNIDACNDLGVDPTDFQERLETIKRLFQLGKEASQWWLFKEELSQYKYNLEKLLTNDDKFALMEYPTKK